MRFGKFRPVRLTLWGLFAIKVNGPELLAVLENCYGDLASAPPGSPLARYADFAKSLGLTGRSRSSRASFDQRNSRDWAAKASRSISPMPAIGPQMRITKLPRACRCSEPLVVLRM